MRRQGEQTTPTLKRAPKPAHRWISALLMLAAAHLPQRMLLADDAQTRSLTPQQTELFEKRVRPLLAERCFGCHGPKKQQHGLRLDSRDAVLKGGETGPAAVAGKPADSLLIQAVEHQNDLKMPPKGKLSTEQIESLKSWVTLGLPWPADNAAGSRAGTTDWKKHWAFQPVHATQPPDVKNVAWPRNSIDRFILARLEAAGLQPSPEADRRTLIRRATFDLTGLPPTWDEEQAFVNDAAPDAYEKLIDALLASPHYGERYGRYWLDVARYADSKGYVFFEEKNYPWAYTYRDYVVEAHNGDLPFDRFLLEQLAADQLERGSDKQPLRALGFLTLGGRFMNNMHDIMDDRIDVVSRGLLGLTVTCARCHDHKFDPIPQDDYYALYGVFRSTTEPILPPLFEAPPDTPVYRKFETEMNVRWQKLDTFVTNAHRELVTSARARVREYLLAAHALRDQPPTDDFMLLVDKGDLNPMMVLRWQVYLQEACKKDHPVWTVWKAFAALPEGEFAARAGDVAARLLRDKNAVPQVSRRVIEVVCATPPATLDEVAQRYAQLLTGIDKKWHEACQQAQRENHSPPAALDDPGEEQLRRVFYGPEAPPDVPVNIDWGALTLLPDRPSQDEFKKLLAEVEKWSMTGPGAPPRAMTLVDSSSPYEPRVFQRGNPSRPGRFVTRHFLSALDPEQKPLEPGSGRLALARDLVKSENPLTARVFVNRLWLDHFGRGLVETPSDFGVRTPPPTHPELLDHLAAGFVQSGWSMKHMHRWIMLSAAYRQQSSMAAEAPAADPENRLLWRMNRRRLDFESMRDALLAATETLDERMAGTPVDIVGDAFVARRTLYGYIDRMDLPGLMRAFDYPDPSATSPMRDITTVPPQALYLMNHPFVIEAARRMATNAVPADRNDVDACVVALFERVYARRPGKTELNQAREFLGNTPTQEQWTSFVQALLMANEFVFVD